MRSQLAIAAPAIASGAGYPRYSWAKLTLIGVPVFGFKDEDSLAGDSDPAG